MKMKYDGHRAEIDVRLPTRWVRVGHGETIEVSSEEASLLSELPGWKKASTPKPTTQTDEEVQ